MKKNSKTIFKNMNKKNKNIVFGVIAIAVVSAFIFVSKDILKSKAGSAIQVKDEKGETKILDLKVLKTANVCRKIYLKSEPVYKDETIDKRVLRLCRRSYAAHYDPMLKMPLSITYNIKWLDLKERTVMPVPSPFRDPDFPIKEIATTDDYITTGYYTQGFLTDYRDFVKNSNTKWTDKKYIAVNQANYKQANYSSITFPIVKYNFLDGVWADLNDQTYSDLEKFKSLTVVMGPVFLKGSSLGILGESKIPIPTHFYKIIYNEKKRGASVYIFPNKEIITAKSTAIHDPSNVHYCQNEKGVKKYCEPNDFLIKFRNLEELTGQVYFSSLTSRAAVRVKQDVREAIERKEKRPSVPAPELK